MNKLKLFIQKLPLDKKEHCVLGVLTGLPMIMLFGNWGGLVAIILYGLKEIAYDKLLGKGKMEFLDWLWTSIPVIIGLIILNIK